MRSTALHRLLCAFITILTFLLSPSVSAQSDVRVSLHFEKAKLQKIFTSIESQTAYRFVFTSEQLKGEKPVTISVNQENLDNALKICFQDQPVTYSQDGNYLILQLKPKPVSEDRITVSGNIRNEKSDPVAGVAVSVYGSDKTVTTDLEGNFTLQDVPVNATLTCSGTNVQTKQIAVHGQHTLNIILKNKVDKLDDVQIIAYGTTTKRINTGDVSTIPKEIIEEQPVSNPLAALEGRAPGLIVTQSTGVPGSGFFVQIRGRNSLASGNNPLYVIDGVPYPSASLASVYTNTIIGGGNPLSSISPADIESINILKDADATAIYGSRGANGVVLITTKRGKAGKTKADLNTYFGVGEMARKMTLMNTSQYLTMRNEAFKNDGAEPTLDNGDYDLFSWDTTRYTDWQKTLIGNTAHISDVQLNISGGNNNTQFILGGTYHRETTVFPGDFADQKASGHFSLNHTSTDNRFRVDVAVTYGIENNSLPALDFVSQAMSLPPDAPPIYDSTGNLNWADGFDNPYSYLQRNYKAKTNNLISHVVLNYALFSDLQLRVSTGYNNIQISEMQITPTTAFNPAYHAISGFNYFSNSSLQTWIIEPQAEYQKKIGPGKLDVLLGMTFEQDTKAALTQQASGFSSDALIENIGAASTIRVLSNSNSEYRYEALFARINYNVEGKYILNLTGRRDGSSRFGPDRQFANFGSVGAAWIFSQEDFFRKSVPFISFGKLRSSYGTTGNDQIGDYQYLSTYSVTPYPYQNQPGLLPTRLYNADYAWETNKKFEVGLDLGMFSDRLLFSASYYNNRSSNQLVGKPLPYITGFSTIQQNLPALVQNTGMEFSLNYAVIKSGKFNWNISTNLTIPRNELVSFPGISESGYQNVYVVGMPLSVYKSFEYLRVDPQAGIYVFVDNKGESTLSPVYPDDLKAIKSVSPQYYGGLQNSFQYKGWRLDIFFQFTKQTGWNYILGYQTTPGMFGNQPEVVLNRWQTPGDQKPFQKYSQTYDSAWNAYLINSVLSGDNTIGDASFIRLKNVSLSYSFPEAILSKWKIQNLRIYLQGQNLITISHYFGIDPESQSSTSLPPLRVITAGIQITL